MDVHGTKLAGTNKDLSSSVAIAQSQDRKVRTGHRPL
jgi:hypothetical protein